MLLVWTMGLQIKCVCVIEGERMKGSYDCSFNIIGDVSLYFLTTYLDHILKFHM
jgi:hypothetical protein